MACTIADPAHLPEARVVAESFRRQQPFTPFVVLVVDPRPQDFADEPFEVLGVGDVGLPVDMTFDYTAQELTYAATPFLMRTLLDMGARRVLFLKQETIVASSARRAFDQLHHSNVMLVPHLTALLDGDDALEREVGIIRSGAYNVGVIGVREHQDGRRFLNWWAERCTSHCRHDVERGLHFEQRWLALVPGMFDGVHVERDPSVNVGHWNLPTEELTLDADGTPCMGGTPVLAYRFSGFDAGRPERATRYDDRLAGADLGAAADMLRRYREWLDATGHGSSAVPYAFDQLDDGTPIPAIARRLHAGLDEQQRQRFGSPFAVGQASFHEWACSAGPDERGFGPFWDAVHAARTDLQAAFPDPHGADAAAFAQWVRRTGVVEHDAAGWLESQG